MIVACEEHRPGVYTIFGVSLKFGVQVQFSTKHSRGFPNIDPTHFHFQYAWSLLVHVVNKSGRLSYTNIRKLAASRLDTCSCDCHSHIKSLMSSPTAKPRAPVFQGWVPVAKCFSAEQGY